MENDSRRSLGPRAGLDHRSRDNTGGSCGFDDGGWKMNVTIKEGGYYENKLGEVAEKQ